VSANSDVSILCLERGRKDEISTSLTYRCLQSGHRTNRDEWHFGTRRRSQLLNRKLTSRINSKLLRSNSMSCLKERTLMSRIIILLQCCLPFRCAFTAESCRTAYFLFLSSCLFYAFPSFLPVLLPSVLVSSISFCIVFPSYEYFFLRYLFLLYFPPFFLNFPYFSTLSSSYFFLYFLPSNHCSSTRISVCTQLPCSYLSAGS
jgi:hypothetical protein